MKQYFLTPEIEVVEAIMKFPHAPSINQKDYTFSWRKGNGKWQVSSPESFTLRIKNESWIARSKKDLEILGLL